MNTLTSLVTAAQGGDLDAFGQVVARFQRMAYAVAYTMLGDAHLAEGGLLQRQLQDDRSDASWSLRLYYKTFGAR